MGRMDKVNQQLKREVGQIIQRELSDPRLEFVTITRADVSPDLRNARIYFSVLGSSEQLQKASDGLRGARGMIRRLIGKKLNLRYTPDINFEFDKSIEEGMRMEETLKEIKNDYEEDH